MNEACLNLSVGSAEQVYQVVGIFEHVRLWPKSDLQVIGDDVSTACHLNRVLRLMFFPVLAVARSSEDVPAKTA